MKKKLKSTLCILLSAAMLASCTAFAKKVTTSDSESKEEIEIFCDGFDNYSAGPVSTAGNMPGWNGATSAITAAAAFDVIEEEGNKYGKFSNKNDDKTVSKSPRLDLLLSLEGSTNYTVSFKAKTSGIELPAGLYYSDTEGDMKNARITKLIGVNSDKWTDVKIVLNTKKSTFECFVDEKSTSTGSYDPDGRNSILVRFNPSVVENEFACIDDVRVSTTDTNVGGIVNIITGEINFDKIEIKERTGVLDVVKDTHPRIFFNDIEKMKKNIETNYDCKRWFDSIVSYTEAQLATEPIKYQRNDRNNINDCSTNVREKVIPMALAACLTGRQDFVDRLYKELVSVGEWPDWGADAWLCTAHLLLGYGCSYDWCYHLFTPEQRANIIDIMKKKGFSEAVKSYERIANTAPVTNKNNWCQVCNGAVIVAALSVWDEEKDLADYMLSNALPTLLNGLGELKADGSYCEPLSYWNYGILYQAKAMSALDSCLEDGKKLPAVADYTDYPGMSKTGDFPIYYNGTTATFCYGDGHLAIEVPPVLFWLATKYNRPDWSGYVLMMEQRFGKLNNKEAAEALCWYDPECSAAPSMPLDREYHNDEANGANGLSFRDGFESKNALVAMMIAGDLTSAHSDLYIGGFVLDWAGKRWVHMYGTNPAGISTAYGWPNFHSHTPLNGHYQYYHCRAEANNTLIANPTEYPDQNYQAFSKVIKSGFSNSTSYGVVDMTPTNDAFTDAKRGMMLTDNRTRLIIQDEVKLNQKSEIYWFANTLADATVSPDRKSVLLDYEGDRMLVRMIKAPDNAEFEIMDTVPLPTSPNPSVQPFIDEHKLAIHLTDVSDSLDLSVEFIPLSDMEGIPAANKFVPISEWKEDPSSKVPLKNDLYDTVALKINTPKAFANGEYTYVDNDNYDVMPIIKDDRTLVPVRFISEGFGADVKWDANARKVSVKYKDKDISLTLDDKNMIVNGTSTELDVPAQIVNDRTFIPLRALVEALGKEVMWDDRGLIMIADSTDYITDAAKNELIDRFDFRVLIGGKEFSGLDIDKTDYFVISDNATVEASSNNNADKASANGNSVTFKGKTYTFTFVSDEFKDAENIKGAISKILVEPEVVSDIADYQCFIPVEHVYSDNFGTYPERGTVDGIISDDTANRWSYSGKASLCFDLGADKNVHSFSMATMTSEERSYKLVSVEVSSDNQNWTTVLSNVATNSVSGPTVFDLGDKTCRYIKITGDGFTGKTDGTWNSWAEVRFYENADMEKYDISHWIRTFGNSYVIGKPGESKNLIITGIDSEGNKFAPDTSLYKFSFASSDPAVASVDENGNVSFLSEGNATIRITAKGPTTKTGTIRVNVR